MDKGANGFVKDSRVFFNSPTNNVIVVDAADNFITGFNLNAGSR